MDYHSLAGEVFPDGEHSYLDGFYIDICIFAV